MSLPNLFARIEPLLARVERPSRYINSEYGAVHSDEHVDCHVGFCYPGTYEVGQANQALQILCYQASRLDSVSVQRVFLPWVDLSELMRSHDIPLFTLEECNPVRDLDILGITLPYELSFTTILEALDLAKIPFYSRDRDESYPLIIGGGPSVYNPEPVAGFFDAFLVGEGEEAVAEIIGQYREWKQAGESKTALLKRLASLSGVYVPSLYNVSLSTDELTGAAIIDAVTPNDGLSPVIYKRVVTNMDEQTPPTCPVVPYMDVVHDRFALEVLRGCTRGCRFCQAGMTYRPVRERSADEIVKLALKGIACTGYDDVSLTSLSTADHSQLEEVLRRLNKQLQGSGVSVSLPSLRVDAFSVDMARLIAGSGKKSGLTFAPEAGTQRLRNVINKNVDEQQLLDTIGYAFDAGWRRVKLYFMIGLPTETDADIEAIGQLAYKVFEVAREHTPKGQRGNIRIGVSVSTFVPKAHTPFQWEPQNTLEEIYRKHKVLRDAMPRKGIELSYHDAEVSFLEGVVARGGRDLAPVLVQAWKNGARFDAWSEQFRLSRWIDAFETCDFDPTLVANRERSFDEILPWDHLSTGVSKSYLKREALRARDEKTTKDCSFSGCTGCDACDVLGVDIVVGGVRS